MLEFPCAIIVVVDEDAAVNNLGLPLRFVNRFCVFPNESPVKARVRQLMPIISVA